MNKIKKEIVKCDLEGNIIKTFNTQVEAGIEAGVTKHVIYRCCKNKNKILNGYKYYINEIELEYNNKNFKCPYCDRTFDTYNGLSKHIIRFKAHGEISQEKLLSDYKYEGKRPLCACGCGKETEIGYQGEIHFNELIQGHYSKIHNNWGNNEKALEHSAETRKSRFNSGDIIQWNKNKSWDETYTDEQIEKLKYVINNPIRNKKISNKLKNVPKSADHIKKIKIAKNKVEAIIAARKVMYDRLKNGTFSISSKAEKDFAIKFLDSMDIKYETQKYIKDIKQYCDFYVPENQVFIEFDGDFWHCNPIKYPNGPINKNQTTKIEKDRIKNEWFGNHKEFKLIRIWESDVKNDEENVLKQLECLL